MLYVCIIIILDWSKNSQGHFFALRKSLEVSMGNSTFYWFSNPSTVIHCWEKIQKLRKWVWHNFIKNIGQYLNACHSLLAWQRKKKVIFKQDNHWQWKMNLLKVQNNGKLVELKRNSLSRFREFVINCNCKQLVCLGKKDIFFSEENSFSYFVTWLYTSNCKSDSVTHHGAKMKTFFHIWYIFQKTIFLVWLKCYFPK